MKFSALRSRCIPFILSCIVLLGAPTSLGQAQDDAKQATNDGTLDGPYFAHDFIVLLTNEQLLGEGTRTFNENGFMNRLFTFPASTPLNYEVASDATYRLYNDDRDRGFVGSIGLGGSLTVFSQEVPQDADPNAREGYASLEISVRKSSGLGDATFAGSYSYHSLLRRADSIYQNSFGVATSNGQGRYFLIRESNTAYAYDYDVDSYGRIDLGPQGPNHAAISAGGDLVVNTADLGRDDDPEIPGGYTGLALYLRRFPNNDATVADFRGSYRIHRLYTDGNNPPRSQLGQITAGGNGYFFGKIDGQAYSGQLALNSSGTFTLMGNTALQGTLGANGNVAVVTSNAGTAPSMALWIRTAGGPGNSLDRDGDGLTNTEEGGIGSDPDQADTDGDGLLDNVDERPQTADNIFTATLSESEVTVIDEARETIALSLTLDSNDFPFFAWSMAIDIPWLSASSNGGFGDTTIDLEIDPGTLALADSPYEATISIAAPAMAARAPQTLTVTVISNQIPLEVTPTALDYTVIQEGEPHTQTVSLSSPDGDDFSWQLAEAPPWVVVTPTTGEGPADITIEVDPTTLLAESSPYTASVIFVPVDKGTSQAAVALSVEVLPPREVGTSFPLIPSEDAQSQPALAFDKESGLWLLTWVEEAQIFGLFLDETLIPVTAPRKLSISALGMATNPVAVIVEETREAWVIWEQRANTMSDGFIQARAFDLTDRSLDNGFGFSTAVGDKSSPSATYNSVADEVVVVFDQEVNDKPTIGYVRVGGNSRSTVTRAFPLSRSNPQSLPAVAWLADTNMYLVAWRETVITEDDAEEMQIVAVRIDGSNGEVLGDALILAEAISQIDNIRVVAANNFGRWVVTWTEASSLNQATTLQSISVTSGGDASTRYTVDTSQRASTPVEMVFNDDSRLVTMLWSQEAGGGDDALVYRHVAGTGQPLGNRLNLPDTPVIGSSTAVGANPIDNEFLLVWEDPKTAPRQLRGLRIGGGSGDVDDDGLPNEWELTFGLDPFSAEGDDGSAGDPDGDGLSNDGEFQLGTDPSNPDSDDDGLLDGQEDANNDGVIEEGETSPLDSDSDNDGVQDDVEWFLGSDGTDPNDTPDTGIYRIAYGTWTPGVADDLVVSLYIAESGPFALRVNAEEAVAQQAPDGWLLRSEDGGTFQVLEPGSHTITYSITPVSVIDAARAYGSFRFDLDGEEDGLIDRRTVMLVADLLEPHTGSGAISAQALAETYAPVLRLHRDAVFTPIPVELSFGKSMLDLGNTMILPVAANAVGLLQSPYREAFLDLPGEDTDALFEAYPLPEERPTSTTYYTVTKLGAQTDVPNGNSRHIAIQYYLHFFADLWGLDQQGGHRHEGDWEVFQVLLDDAGVAYQASATQQWQLAQADEKVSGGESRPWTALELADEKRPVLYVGKGSHSLQFEPGATSYEGGLDVYDGTGYWMIPEGDNGPLTAIDYDKRMPMTLSPLQRLNEHNATPWLGFPGRWGQAKYPVPTSDYAEAGTNDGPVGPAFMGTTLSSIDPTGVLRIWSEPYAFSLRMPNRQVTGISKVVGRIPPAFRNASVVLLDARGRLFRGEIDDIRGEFELNVPSQHYAMALATYDDLERPTLRAAVRFQSDALNSMLFQARVGECDLGPFSSEGGNLTSNANYGVNDADGDGTVDGDDADADNDGIENDDDDDLLGDGWADAYQAQDPDSDNIPRFFDSDDDGDGITDNDDLDQNGNDIEDTEDPADLDRDGFYDVIDLDQDNDGFDDATENAAGTDPRHYLDTPLRRVGDLDGDGDVDAADGQQLVNQGLGRAAYSPRADYDLNGSVDAIDLQRLVNNVLAISP